MQRNALATGTAIQLNNQEYIVDEVIGDGATCIVYSAWYTDNAGFHHRVNLKECYPFHAHITRIRQDLHWESQDEQTQYLKSFINTYEKLMVWQDESSSVKVFDLCKANNTLYIIMNADKGITFDKDSNKSLCDILKTIQLLTHFVGKYHENGYLHLDIKPSNFLIYPRPSEHIILFDMDSVTAIDDIRSGTIHSVSYSDGWAAPEQKQGRISKLSPATDIYSIGAILFEKIMGRQVTPTDMGTFAEWNFDDQIFENANPKIRRILSDIFRKTLAANRRRRYQSVAELSEKLEIAYEVASAKQFIVSHKLQIPAHFIGRESDICEIHKAFENNNSAVFLHGIGGIGKSTLATAYALTHKNDYDTVLFCRYKGSLDDLLSDLIDEIQNFEGDTRDGIRLLKRLLDENTLLIVDNFDIATDKDPYLHQFLKFKAKLLFTTRTDFRSILSKSSAQLEVPPLPYDQLQSLFADISRVTINTEEQQHCLHSLLQTVDYHTYITELLARQIVSSGWSLDTLARKIKTGISNLATAERVQATKDDRSSKQTIPEGLRVLFDLAALEESAKQVLRNMYLLDGFVAVTKDTYRQFCTSELRVFQSSFSYFITPDSSTEISVLNDLCELGWVQEVHARYTLHPLVSELIREDLEPCSANCIKLYEYINSILLSFKRNYDFDEADAKEHENHYDLLCAYLAHADFEISDNRQMALDFINAVIETSSEWLEERNDCRNIIEKLLLESRNSRFSAQEAFEVHLIRFKVGLWRFMDIYYNDAQDEYLFDTYKSVQNAVSQLTADMDIANTQIDDEIKRKLTLDHHHLPIDFVKLVCHERPAIFEVLSEYQKDLYDLLPQKAEVLSTNQSEHDITGIDECAENADDDNHLEAWEAKIQEIHDNFEKAQDKLSFAKDLHAKSGLKVYQVVACLLEYCDNLFDRVSSNCYNYSSSIVANMVTTIDWCGIKETLDYVEQIRSSAEWQTIYDSYSLDDEMCIYSQSIYTTHLWYIELAAIQSRWDDFDQLIKQTIPIITNYRAGEIYTQPIWIIASTCWNLGQCHHILPHLVRDISAKEQSEDFDERDNVSFYEEIVAYAKKACTEVEEGSSQYFECRNIIDLYTQRVNKMTGKYYVLKKEIETSPE